MAFAIAIPPLATLSGWGAMFLRTIMVRAADRRPLRIAGAPAALGAVFSRFLFLPLVVESAPRCSQTPALGWFF